MAKVFKGKFLVVLLSLAFLLILAGCGESAEQTELLKYINEDLETVAELEAIVIEEYEAVTGDNYTNDFELYASLVDIVIPNSLRLIDAAEALEVSSKELRDIHEIYISAVNKQHAAFTEIMSAIETEDLSKVTSANEKLSEARKLMRDYSAEMNAYAKKVKVEILQF